jgi:hypothetical protein
VDYLMHRHDRPRTSAPQHLEPQRKPQEPRGVTVEKYLVLHVNDPSTSFESGVRSARKRARPGREGPAYDDPVVGLDAGRAGL